MIALVSHAKGYTTVATRLYVEQQKHLPSNVTQKFGYSLFN